VSTRTRNRTRSPIVNPKARRRELLRAAREAARLAKAESRPNPNLDDYDDDGDFYDDAPADDYDGYGSDDDAKGMAFDGGFDDLRLKPAATGMELDVVGESELRDGIVAVPQTFEQLVAKHLSKFIANAAKYATETRLSARVDAWHERLSLSLEVEEARPSFDIHSYGDACVNKVKHLMEQSEGASSSFTDVVAGAPRYECARMFLATLQLANAGRVRIDPSMLNMPLEVPDLDVDTPRKLLAARSKAKDASPLKLTAPPRGTL